MCDPMGFLRAGRLNPDVGCLGLGGNWEMGAGMVAGG